MASILLLSPMSPEMVRQSPKSAPERRADALQRAIEEEIFAGRFAPGHRLDEQALAERYGVSRTPVREALRSLAQAGLVDRRPHRGAVVATLTVSRMIEMFEVMAELEGMCARLAARRITPAEMTRLDTLHAAASEPVAASDIDTYYDLNQMLHEGIYAASRNGFLEEMTRSLRNRLAPFRRHQLQLPGRLRASHQEHGRILEAIRAGDADGAAAAITTHVSIQGDTFADVIARLPQLFAEEATNRQASPGQEAASRQRRPPSHSAR
jgi:DNA-binding GntR family transcriptional regulator